MLAAVPWGLCYKNSVGTSASLLLILFVLVFCFFNNSFFLENNKTKKLPTLETKYKRGVNRQREISDVFQNFFFKLFYIFW